MSEAVLDRTAADAALAAAHAAIDQLQAVDWAELSEADLLEQARELERLRRRLPAVEHALVREIDARGLPAAHHVRTLGQFLRMLLRLDPREAHGRVQAARAFGRRRSLAGEPLPAEYEHVAAAQDAGELSERHAALIVKTIHDLPLAIRDERGEELEAELVGYALRFDPDQLARLARRLSACLDPDGVLHDAKERDRLRALNVLQRPDGSARINGELTAEAAEYLLLHLDAFAAPKSGLDGSRDARSAAQRRHDALLEALKLNVRAQQLPTVAGVTATLIVTMTAEQYAAGAGLVRTGHGALVPAQQAFEWAAGDYRLFVAVLDTVTGITAHSSTRRLFSENQRLALIARDGGCTFPNCPTPAHWCQTDHLLDYQHTGHTTLAEADLSCPYDNRMRKAEGWRPAHINGRIAWIPPPWIDPEQKPQYNNLHRPDDPR
jgi:hypothetical protein